MMPPAEPELPELSAEIVGDEERLAEITEEAVAFFIVMDAQIVEIERERRLQEDLLKDRVSMSEWAHVLSVRDLTERFSERLLLRVARWAFEAGRRSDGATP